MEGLVSGRLPSAEFWRGQRVFVTGHTGFKGGWLALWLAAMGASVQGYALPPPTEPNLFGIARIHERVAHTAGDIRDLESLSASLAGFAPDIVIHLAAQPLVMRSYALPVETFDTNVMGTVHLLEAVRATPSVRATLIVTSDKCYENHNTGHPYREHDPMGGHDPYSSSKGCAELVTSSYARSFFAGRALGSGRAGNVIGGGDWAPDRLMTDLLQALLAGRAPILRAPHSIRPWQHVLEPLAGYLVALEQLAASPVAGDVWNFGPDPHSEVTVEDLASRVCRLWGGDIRPVIEPTAAPGKEATLLTLDSGKARRELQWRPRWSLDRALGATVEWFRAWQSSTDMQRFMHAQIADYTGATLPLFPETP